MRKDVSAFHLESPHIAEYAEHLAGPWELEYEQLEGGAALHSIEGVNVGRDAVYIERSTRRVGIRGCVEPGTLLICLPVIAQGHFWGKEMDRRSILFVTGAREVEVSIPDLHNVEATIDEGGFRQCYRDACGRDPDFLNGDSPGVQIDPHKAQLIEQRWRQLASGREPIPPGYSLCKAVAQLLAEVISPDQGVSRMTSRQFKQVREGMAFWEASNFGLSVAQICQRLGVSERTLGNWFKAQHGLSPYQYLQRRRLNLAHRALLAADPETGTVTEIAMRFGFHELGRFAGVYRRFFGELPSRTLERPAGGGTKTATVGGEW